MHLLVSFLNESLFSERIILSSFPEQHNKAVLSLKDLEAANKVIKQNFCLMKLGELPLIENWQLPSPFM